MKVLSLILAVILVSSTMSFTEAQAKASMSACVAGAQGFQGAVTGYSNNFQMSQWEQVMSKLRNYQAQCGAYRFLHWPNGNCKYVVELLYQDLHQSVTSQNPDSWGKEVLAQINRDLAQIARVCQY